MKQKMVLIVSVVVGLLAAFLTRSYLTAKDRETAQMRRKLLEQFEQITVMTVNKDLPSGTVLTSGDLASISAIKNVVRGKAIEEVNSTVLIGRKTMRALKKGDIIYWVDIEGGGPDARGLAADIKKEMRAISVNVSGAAAVSGMVQPTDHVDVLGTFSFPSKTVQGEMELVTLTILQDVLVLATGKETAKTRLFAGNASGATYSTVTLEVTPREAEMLAFSEQIKGRLLLTLRNPDDVYTEATLPRVNFDKIQSEIEERNKYRQEKINRRR